MLAEAEGDQAEFHRLQDDLRHASVINEKMRRIHGEHDAQLELYRQLVESLLERWQAVLAQLDLRQQELNLLGRHMKSYRGSYDWLLRWLTEARQRQENLQALPLGHGSVLNHQLAEGKVVQELKREISPPFSCDDLTERCPVPVCRNSGKRSRETRTTLKIVSKMQRPTSIQSKSVLPLFSWIIIT